MTTEQQIRAQIARENATRKRVKMAKTSFKTHTSMNTNIQGHHSQQNSFAQAKQAPVRKASDYHQSRADDDIIRSQRKNLRAYRKLRRSF